MTDALELLGALLAAEVTHVVGIPDNTSAPLFDALAAHPSIRLVTATREGEAIAVAAGLWIGGARPLVVIQNTGLLEAGDALRGVGTRLGAPIPLLVTGRGYAKMRAAEVTPADARTRALLTRPDVDSVAPLTEPTLDAWGVPFELCEGDGSPAEAVARAIRRADASGLPAAAVVARSLA